MKTGVKIRPSHATRSSTENHPAGRYGQNDRSQTQSILEEDGADEQGDYTSADRHEKLPWHPY